MTEVQSIMLTVCFGCCAGHIVGCISFLVTEGMRRHREKKSRRKAE